MERRTASAVLFGVTVVNLVAACALGYSYVSLAGATSGLKHGLFIRAAAVGQISLFFLFLALGLLALSRARIGRMVLPVLAPMVFGALGTFLLLDQAIYRFYKFHFNWPIVSILLDPVMREATKVNRGDVLALAGIGALFFAGEALVYWLVTRRAASASRALWSPRWVALFAVVLGLLAIEKGIYAVGDLRGERHIVRSARAVPFYQRVTIRDFAQFLGIVPKKMSMVRTRAVDPAAAQLLYPRKPLTFETPAKLPNILWVNLEGWRWDMFNPENTPNIDAWSKDQQVFEYHVSGGNRTATGVFSMFYGLYGNYWDTFLSERKPPVLVNRLRELGYRIDADASREVGFFDMKSATFVDIPEAYHFDWKHDDSALRDQLIVDHAKAFMSKSKEEGKPFFQWILFDSSHVKYYFPPEFAKFEPYAKEVSYREMGTPTPERQVEARNRYRNAVYFEDTLVKALLDHLAALELEDDTIVIVSGDHGEEFYENGYWTHGGGCTPQVVRVPMIVHLPGKAPARHSHVTAHHDIVPTLMEVLGTKSPAEDYTLGRSLFGAERVPHVVACGWDQSALIDESGWLIYGNDFANPWDYELRDPAYVEVSDSGNEMERRTTKVAGAIRNMNAFLKN